jgi:hypothetical protein
VPIKDISVMNDFGKKELFLNCQNGKLIIVSMHENRAAMIDRQLLFAVSHPEVHEVIF